MRRAVLILGFGFVVLLAGCTVPQAASDSERMLTDERGVVDGIAHDDDISVTVDDGLNETELELLTKRSMARIEVIRNLTFERNVDVEVITREEYRSQRAERQVNETRSEWNNQIWKSLFIVGQDRDVTEVFNRTYGSAVQGYYSTSDERIVIVSDGETTTISKDTLIHELVHALQDQQFGLGGTPSEHDASMARNGVVEGEANLVPELYLDRCTVEWSCIRPPSGGGGGQIDRGVFQIIYQPYVQGPVFVDAMRDRGGWEKVDSLHDSFPVSTEQTIHPEKYPDETPVDVIVPDRSTSDWSRFDLDENTDTIGEATIYSMFLHNDVVHAERYSYTHPVSQGWNGDEIVPYRNDDGEFGYVWQLAWDTREDAEEFYEAYLELLDEHDAQERGQQRFVVPDGPFEDAFQVTHDGYKVTIVNGPTVDSLSEIHDP